MAEIQMVDALQRAQVLPRYLAEASVSQARYTNIGVFRSHLSIANYCVIVYIPPFYAINTMVSGTCFLMKLKQYNHVL